MVMPSDCSASARISSSFLACSACRRGCHPLLRRSSTSLIRKRTRLETLGESPSSLSRFMKPSNFFLPASLPSPDSASCLPATASRSQRASRKSSCGTPRGSAPKRSLMIWCMIFSGTMAFLYSSAIRRMLPSVRCLTRRSCSLRSSPAGRERSWLWASKVWSNSSLQVLSRTLRNVMGLVSPSTGGHSGSSRASASHRSPYIDAYDGSATAFSKMRAMVSRSTSTVVMISSIWLNRRSNFSGASLFRIDRMARRDRSRELMPERSAGA